MFFNSVKYLFSVAVEPDTPERLQAQIQREDTIEVDFSGLSTKMLDLTKTQYDAALNAYVEKINALSIERESIAPNLKALGKN